MCAGSRVPSLLRLRNSYLVHFALRLFVEDKPSVFFLPFLIYKWIPMINKFYRCANNMKKLIRAIFLYVFWVSLVVEILVTL